MGRRGARKRVREGGGKGEGRDQEVVELFRGEFEVLIRVSGMQEATQARL